MSGGRQAQLVEIKRPLIGFPLWVRVTVFVIRLVVRVVRWALRHWRVTAPVLALVWVWRQIGTWPLVTLVGLVLAVLVVWRFADRASFDLWVRWPVTSQWRYRWRYGRSWDATMKGCGLVVKIDGVVYVPRLLSVASSPAGDVVRLRMLRGQTPETFTKAADALGYAFGSRMCRVLSGRVNIRPVVHTGWVGRLFAWWDRRRFGRDVPSEMTVMIVRGDLLSYVVPPVSLDLVPAAPSLAALPVGLVEDGSPYLLRLANTHLLIAGATGAGKGSVMWSLLRALAGGIRSGLVQVWAIDPKGGMELAMGRGLFTAFEYTHVERMADLLDSAVLVMRDRQARLAGRVRQHTPSRHDPTIVVLIDELATLTAYLPDRKLRDRIASALALLLSQGRALGVHVVAAVQDPSKDVVDFRDLFPTRIALRLNEDVQVTMVLGEGARNRGAYADRIPVGLPGVGYVVLDNRPEPARVRFSYLSDNDIAETAGYFPAPLVDVPTIPAQSAPVSPAPPADTAHNVVPAGLLDKLRGDR